MFLSMLYAKGNWDELWLFGPLARVCLYLLPLSKQDLSKQFCRIIPVAFTITSYRLYRLQAVVRFFLRLVCTQLDS